MTEAERRSLLATLDRDGIAIRLNQFTGRYVVVDTFTKRVTVRDELDAAFETARQFRDSRPK